MLVVIKEENIKKNEKWHGSQDGFNKKKQLKCSLQLLKRNSKIPKGQTEIVKSRTDKTMANKMKRKTNIEHTTLD